MSIELPNIKPTMIVKSMEDLEDLEDMPSKNL